MLRRQANLLILMYVCMYICMYVNILLSIMKMYRNYRSPTVINTDQPTPTIDMQLLCYSCNKQILKIFFFLIDICFDLNERLQWAVLTHWNSHRNLAKFQFKDASPNFPLRYLYTACLHARTLAKGKVTPLHLRSQEYLQEYLGWIQALALRSCYMEMPPPH